MTNPPSSGLDPVTTWQQLYLDAPTAAPSQAACVSAAFRLADTVWRQVAADPRLDATTRQAVTDQTNWARTAVAAYEHLHASGAYRHLDLPALLRCTADENRIRHWLTSPSPLPGLGMLTVAETWEINDDFRWDNDHIAVLMDTLIEQAQHAGVFGVPGYTIHLRHVLATNDDTTDHLDSIVEHQVTLTCPSGAVLASAPMATDHLADDHVSGVDAAVAVLTNTAVTVNDLLTAERLIITDNQQARPQQPPPARPHRGFAALDLHTVGTEPAAIETAPPPLRSGRPTRR